jgi:anthranilate phosphoribosyltransferase
MNAGAALYIVAKQTVMRTVLILRQNSLIRAKPLKTLNKLIEVSNRPEVEV